MCGGGGGDWQAVWCGWWVCGWLVCVREKDACVSDDIFMDTKLIEFGYNGGLIVTRKTESCHTYMNQSYLTHTYLSLPHTN